MMRMPGLEGMAVKPGMELFHLADLSTPLNLVGFEHHPHGGNLYACSSGNAEGLWEVADDGQMTYIGSIGFSCNDLAAPWANPLLPEG